MIRGICDTPDRVAARLYLWARTDCPCCTFYRGTVLGFVAGAAIAASVAVVAFLP